MEEDLEALFDDDLDLDDPPPLPPPLPDFGSSHQLQNNTPSLPDGNLNGTGPVVQPGPLPRPLPLDSSQGPPAKKRKPLLTLKVDRIFSDKGLPYLENEFPKFKFKGKGHEHADLKFLMQQYEHWGNRLYPKFTFKDLTQRIEKLSTRKDFKHQLVNIRRSHAVIAHGGRQTATGTSPPPEHEEETSLPDGGSGQSRKESNGRTDSEERTTPSDSEEEGEMTRTDGLNGSTASENGTARADVLDRTASPSSSHEADVLDRTASPSSSHEADVLERTASPSSSQECRVTTKTEGGQCSDDEEDIGIMSAVSEHRTGAARTSSDRCDGEGSGVESEGSELALRISEEQSPIPMLTNGELAMAMEDSLDD